MACSRVRHITDLLFTPPFTFQRLSSLSNSQRLRERQLEDQRLLALQPSSSPCDHSLEDLSPPTPDLSSMDEDIPPPSTPPTPDLPSMDENTTHT